MFGVFSSALSEFIHSEGVVLILILRACSIIWVADVDIDRHGHIKDAKYLLSGP